MSQLRKPLGDRIASTTAGYSLAVPEEEVDLVRFRRLAAEGRSAGRPELAAAGLGAGARVGRGQPLQGIGTAWVEQRVRVPLLREVWGLLEEYAATLIELGRHREVPALLQELRHEEPLRETPHALAMTALWHDGRTAEALELFHVVDLADKALWTTKTAGNPRAWLSVSDDGRVIIYSRDNKPLWTSR